MTLDRVARVKQSRTGGRPTGADPRVVLKVFRELFALKAELSREQRRILMLGP